jgi:hypothetical protein
MNPDFLEVAVRGWTNDRDEHKKSSTECPPPPDQLLVFDTETTTNIPQRLHFGCAKLVRISWKANGDNTYTCLSHEIDGEVIFHADDLADFDPDGYAILASYCQANELSLISQCDFSDKWIRYFCETRPDAKGKVIAKAALTGFNLPFDLSRIAYSYMNGRGKNKKAFTLNVHPPYRCTEGCAKEHTHVFNCNADCQKGHKKHITSDWPSHKFRPRIRITHLDSKKALISWTSCKTDEFRTSKGERRPRTASESGRFLDVKQLIWGMTNKSHTLRSAGEAFGLPPELLKGETDNYEITPEFIAYNRQDTTTTAKLAVAALTEYHTHPIRLQAVKVFSPASIAKAYLREMGITPMMDRAPTTHACPVNCAEKGTEASPRCPEVS